MIVDRHDPPSRSGILAAAVLLALVGVFVACGDSGADVATRPDGPNFLLLSVDTLRADRLGTYGNGDWGVSPSPVIDALAERGVLFEMATVPRGQTRPAIAALLTAKYPITTGVRENGFFLEQEHETVFEALSAGGYQTGVYLANFKIGTMGGGWAFRGGDQIGHGVDPSDYDAPTPDGRRPLNEAKAQRIWDQRVEGSALSFLDQVDPDRPFALWAHFYDVHKPYNPPPGFDRYGHYEGMPDALITEGRFDGRLHEHLDQITLDDRPVPPEELRRILGAYDGAVTATDERVGRILAKLEEIGEADNTVIVLTADHGEELFDRNRYFYHGASIHLGTLQVPLIIAGPELPAGGRSPVPVQNIDIAPTLLDIAGLPALPGAEGRSLLPLLRGETADPPRPYSFFEWQDRIFAAADAEHFYLHNPEHTQPQKPPYFGTDRYFAVGCFEGYDVAIDRRQQNDVLAGEDPNALARDGLPEDFKPLRAALMKWLAEPHHERQMTWPGASDDQLAELQAEAERMRELGYIGLAAEGGDHVRLNDCADN